VTKNEKICTSGTGHFLYRHYSENNSVNGAFLLTKLKILLKSLKNNVGSGYGKIVSEAAKTREIAYS
jgi:hypothetical protein